MAWSNTKRWLVIGGVVGGAIVLAVVTGAGCLLAFIAVTEAGTTPLSSAEQSTVLHVEEANQRLGLGLPGSAVVTTSARTGVWGVAMITHREELGDTLAAVTQVWSVRDARFRRQFLDQLPSELLPGANARQDVAWIRHPHRVVAGPDSDGVPNTVVAVSGEQRIAIWTLRGASLTDDVLLKALFADELAALEELGL